MTSNPTSTVSKIVFFCIVLFVFYICIATPEWVYHVIDKIYNIDKFSTLPFNYAALRFSFLLRFTDLFLLVSVVLIWAKKISRGTAGYLFGMMFFSGLVANTISFFYELGGPKELPFPGISGSLLISVISLVLGFVGLFGYRHKIEASS